MHVISSGAKVILIKIAQRFPDRKRKNGSAVKTAFRAALLCVILACFLPVSNAIHREAANDWRNGWEEWKCGNAAAALGHWSKNPLTAPFEMRPSRVAYWKIRAFEKLGRTEEAALTASMLALRCPRDFYSLVLAYEGRYPTLTRAARKACARAAYMRRWNGEVARASAETGVSKNILLGLIRQESKFNERAVSRSGAVGLMQLMPFTAREAAARLKKDELSPYEPTHNIMLGAAYFAHLKAKFSDKLPPALAAYNAGAASVSRWETDARDWVEWIEEIPYPQTREYVRSVLENIEVYNATDREERRGEPSFFSEALERPRLTKKLASGQKP
ncbi:lytic transglycosylase domain-containing protein [Cloacibacillus evryensis]|uniref:lytic transglycosylase domain-containing protein n=1 Tax=Cloacibacillus evryensis TaxID=508460 RepID=UPI003AB51685